MFSFFSQLLSHDRYIPHGHCYLWQPSLVWLHLLTDALIALAYFSIPLMLIYFVKEKKENTPFPNIFILFSLFIICCGFTHTMGVITLWYPVYWLSGLVKAITALVSLLTAFELFPVIPVALALPSPEKLRKINITLEEEINKKNIAQEQLLFLNQNLENIVQKRTAEIAEVNKLLQKKINFKQLISNIANLFININYTNFSDNFTDVIRDICLTFQLDGGSLVFLNENYDFPSQYFYPETTQVNHLVEDIPSLFTKIKDLELIKQNNIEESFSQDFFIVQNKIKSLLASPIHSHGELKAVLILWHQEVITDWDSVEENSLNLISNIIVNALDNYSLNRALEARNQELKRSNEELEQFAHVASHDLQEPLRTIASFSDLLVAEYQDVLDQEGREYLEFIFSASSQMKLLIQDLLSLSRVQQKPCLFTLVNVNELVQNVLDLLSVKVREKGAVIICDSLPIVAGDQIQLLQLWQNLLNNALKFGDKSSLLIKITVESREDHWLFSVSDNGIGIAPEYQEKIFVIFQRLNSRHEYDGTGIGLTLCRKILTRHGGKIWVQSELGEGSTFFFTIPKVNSLNMTIQKKL